MNTPHRPDDDVPRDARLQAALRHAPDHDAAPPPALNARILEQARQATRPPRADASQGRALGRWFGWLSTPMAAGALGSLLIAGLVGLMWQGGPPPEALPGQDPIAAPAQEATPAAAAAPATQAEPAAPAKPSTALSAPQASQAPPAPPARQTAPQPGAGRAARQDTLAERQREPAPAAPAPTPAPAPAVAPAAAPRPEAAADAKLGSTTGQIQGPGSERAERSEAAIKGAAAPPAATNAQPAARLAAPAHDVLAPVIAELAAVGGAGDAGWRDRLSALRTRVQGEWRPSEPLPPGAGEVVSDALGRPLGRLRVDGPNITWQGNDGRAWQAQMQP